MRKVELLAPAGSLACMRAAIAGGADAVYMGGPKFGARAYAENPETDGLLEAIDYVHRYGKKLYLTVNTLLKEAELSGLYDYLLPFYEAGVDAVLVQDLGVLKLIRERFPDLPVHASTQMTVMDPDGAQALQQLGLTRVVTAREITVPEMRAIADTGIEVEVFVHGAICYCYSGQCLLSSLIGGRSGNRGRCAQPCRLPYEVIREGRTLTRPGRNQVLNLKDMDTLSCLPDIVAAGVASLKIEGRMKSPRYTAGVTAVYRKYLDLCEKGGVYAVDPVDRRYLRELFDRGGYTEYASKGLHDHMVAIEGKPDFRAADEAFLAQHERTLPGGPMKRRLCGQLVFRVGEPVCLSVSAAEETAAAEKTVTVEKTVIAEESAETERAARTSAGEITVTGPVVQQAKSRPMDEETLSERFARLGDTEYEWETFTVDTDGQGFLPVGQLNELRRRAVAAWEETLTASCRREPPRSQPQADSGAGRTAYVPPDVPVLSVSVDSVSQLRTALSYREVARIYLNLSTITEKDEEEAFRLAADRKRTCERKACAGRSGEGIHAAGRSGEGPALYLNLPPVLRASMKEKLERRLSAYEAAPVEGYLVHTWDQAAWLRKRLPEAVLWADASLYTYNKEAEAVLQELGVQGITLPVELNSRELSRRMAGASLPSELIGYGYLPSMVSAQCVRRTVSGCDGRPGLLYLKDRKQKQFAVRNCCRYCFNVIYNSSPLYLLDCRKDWEAYGLCALRLAFTVETEKEMRRILEDGIASLRQGGAPAGPAGDFTRGHFRRGVE